MRRPEFQTNQLTDQMTWKTQDGEILTISQMETPHTFNAMKMLFNHLAVTYNGLQPIWFTKSYEGQKQNAEHMPEQVVRYMLAFMIQIETRKDLPEKYEHPYLQIRKQLFKIKQIKQAITSLNPSERLLLTSVNQ